jgi:DNA-binding GntR family transcriptional regulator
MVRQAKSSTLAGEIHDRIRRDILRGTIKPGTRLQPPLLAEQYLTSTTVIREALTRLSTESIVLNHPQRGFFVQDLSIHELDGLTLVRKHADSLALRLAIEKGDLEWESSVVTAHHVLQRTPRREVANPQYTTEAWSEAHRSFHLALVSACGIPTLQRLAQELFDSTELYRRCTAPFDQPSNRNIEQEHAEIVEAVIARDADQAVSLLCNHYQRSHDIIIETGLIREEDRA